MVWVKRFSRLVDGASHPPPKRGSVNTASVLVPVGRHPADGVEVILLTKRTQFVQTHKGQISFPGGFYEPGDADYRATAIRECHEEIGLMAESVDVLGALPPVETRGQVTIYPWLAAIGLERPLAPSAREVERILYLPVARLIEEGLKDFRLSYGDVQISTIGIELEGELIWGATARILRDLCRLVTARDKARNAESGGDVSDL